MRNWAVLWIASLVVIAALVSALTRAQTNPRILSGSDIGFRVDRTDRTGRPVGVLMVRINGNWVEAAFGPTAVPALTQ